MFMCKHRKQLARRLACTAKYRRVEIFEGGLFSRVFPLVFPNPRIIPVIPGTKCNGRGTGFINT